MSGRGGWWTTRSGTGLAPLALVVALGASGCAKDGNPTDPDPVAEATDVVIVLDHMNGGRPLFPGALINETGADNRYGVDRLRYYVSDVVFHAIDGGTVTRDAYHLRDTADDGTRRWLIPDVPPGAYESVSFTFGLSDGRNQWGALDDTPANAAMRWPVALGDGYHYMWMEGRYVDGDGVTRPFAVETGRVVVGGETFSHDIEVTLPDAMMALSGGTVEIPALMDVDRWFAGDGYDLEVYGTDMAGDLDAQAILRANGATVFGPHQIGPPEVLLFSFQGFPPMQVPDDNPITDDGVLLGRMLFHDPVLSRDSTLACAGCHQQAHAFADESRFSGGVNGVEGTRNAPTIINAGWLPSAFWDGRADGLETQALQPVAHPDEMDLPWTEVARRLNRHPVYPSFFDRVFGTSEIDSSLVTKAIAQFERTLVSVDSKFDRWRLDPTTTPLTDAEIRGFSVFFSERGDCFHCHGLNPLFTDNRFHNVGLDPEFIDLGLGGVTGDPNDFALFKTPTLRNVEFSAPYMHDGRFATLEEVVQHYNSGGFRTPTVDPLIRVGIGLQLTDQDVADLVAFLRTLSDESFVNNPEYGNPFE